MSCSEWKTVRLADLIEIKHGYAFKGKYFSEDETNLILLTPGNFKIGGGFQSKKYKYYNNEGEIPEQYILKKDDLLVTMTDLSKNGDTLGFPLKVPNIDGKTLLHNQRLGKIIINSDLVDSNYLYYLMCSKEYRNEILSSATGTTVKHTAPERIVKFEFKLPPLEEQEKIANILSSLDDKIELNNEMNKTLEEMAQSIFKRWFVDFEFPNEDDQPYKSSGGEMVESERGMIPKGWEVKTIGDLCEVGSSKRIFMKEYVEEGIPFFRGKEVIQKSKGENISTELFITKERYKEIKDKFGVPSKNDILLTSVGTLGIPYLVDDEEFYFKDGNLTWFKNFNEEIFRYYVYQWLLSSEGKKSIDEVTIGSTQKALTINALKSMKLVIPSKNTLNKYQGFISSNIENIRENNVQKFNLIDLRDSLLPKLMSGVLKL